MRTLFLRNLLDWLRSISWIEWVVVVAIVAIPLAYLIPPRPTLRVYFQGKSQSHWMNELLWDEDPEVRCKAAVALGELLRTTEIRRWETVSFLANSGSDGKPAIPALKELLNDPDEKFARHVFSAIQTIEASEAAKGKSK